MSLRRRLGRARSFSNTPSVKPHMPTTPEPQALTPDEELPDWVMSSVFTFLTPFFQRHGPLASGYGMGFGYPEASPRDFVREVESTFHIALPWQQGPQGAADALFRAIQTDRALLARVLDFALGEMLLGYEAMHIDPAIADLSRALGRGSNYEVVRHDPQRAAWRLQRRTNLATTAAVSAQTAIRDEAGKHLDNAWHAAFGRDPNPSEAYSQAIKAVEAVAIPVVTPNDPAATLGTILGQLRSNPQKYAAIFVRDATLSHDTKLSPVETITVMADLLWRNQTDRHAPIVPVTQPQAELAAHLALTLVQAFRAALTAH
jgi:hypothetical protein